MIRVVFKYFNNYAHRYIYQEKKNCQKEQPKNYNIIYVIKPN